jgi:hypothetical protein
MTNVLKELEQRRMERRSSTNLSWRDLVRRIGSGQGEPPAEEIEKILEECRKTLPDLRVAVESYYQREGLAKKAAQKATTDAELITQTNIARIIAEGLEAAMAKVHEEYGGKLHDVQSDIDMLQVKKAETDAAIGELVTKCPYTDLSDQLREIDRELRVAFEKKDRLRIAATNARTIEKSCKVTLDRINKYAAWSDHSIEEDQISSESGQAVAAAVAAETQLAEVGRKYEALLAQREKVICEMLKP